MQLPYWVNTKDDNPNVVTVEVILKWMGQNTGLERRVRKGAEQKKTGF